MVEADNCALALADKLYECVREHDPLKFQQKSCQRPSCQAYETIRPTLNNLERSINLILQTDPCAGHQTQMDCIASLPPCSPTLAPENCHPCLDLDCNPCTDILGFNDLSCACLMTLQCDPPCIDNDPTTCNVCEEAGAPCDPCPSGSLECLCAPIPQAGVGACDVPGMLCDPSDPALSVWCGYDPAACLPSDRECLLAPVDPTVEYLVQTLSP